MTTDNIREDVVLILRRRKLRHEDLAEKCGVSRVAVTKWLNLYVEDPTLERKIKEVLGL